MGASDEKPRRGIYLLPNLLTTTALFAGFYAIVAAVDGNFEAAGVAIFVAMVLDGLDGRVARLTATESDFGKEFDSLSDMVCFGIAPAVVVYQWGVARLAEYSVAWGRVGWLVAFLFAVAAAMRLARFNTSPGSQDKRFFVGLASPSAAGMVAGFVWLSARHGIAGLGGLALAFVITAMAGALMVSNLRYYSFKELNLGSRISFPYLLIIPLVLILISLEPPVVLFSMFTGYALSGPAFWLWRRRRGRRQEADET
ncbi:CDP-diacylglycerol--serine O-phosphatidyltransferase [Lentisalinibacter salinarum]|uniref:CDP-diacylglycerol--serine O-phosphatidyltransferase n=1 Tax=Lentisalinibacter salinarum TaxID=2992239 RepID=UPI003864CA25